MPHVISMKRGIATKNAISYALTATQLSKITIIKNKPNTELHKCKIPATTTYPKKS